MRAFNVEVKDSEGAYRCQCAVEDFGGSGSDSGRDLSSYAQIKWLHAFRMSERD